MQSDTTTEELSGLGSAVIDWLVAHGPGVVGVLVALILAWIIAGIAKRWVLAGLTRAKFDLTLAKFFANVSRYLILLGAVLGCLGAFGIDTTSFAAVLGAAGLAVGLAFQNTLSNFASGVMLLVFRPFRVGDLVEVGGVVGVVEEIELFTTELKTPHNEKIIMPNSSIFGATIKNYTHHDTRRIDIDETRAALEGAVSELEFAVSEPAPDVFLKGLGGSSVDWQVRAHCKPADYWALHQELVRATKYALDGAGIGIPFPQLDVHLDGRLGDGADS